MILIIGAQHEEVNAILKLFDNYTLKKIKQYDYYEGKIKGKDSVLVQGGIGAATSVMMITLFSTIYDIDYVVNVGTAGGVANKGLKTYDIVVSNSLAYYDADVTFFGYKMGQMASCPRAFKADENLANKIKESYPEVKVGDMLSGDKFITMKHNPNEYIKENFFDLNVLTTDMESCAVANVCYLLEIPFVVVRVVSDILGEENQGITYEEVLKESGKVATKIINILL